MEEGGQIDHQRRLDFASQSMTPAPGSQKQAKSAISVVAVAQLLRGYGCAANVRLGSGLATWLVRAR
jgi:hypothetical protein